MTASADLDERSGSMKRSNFSEEQIGYALRIYSLLFHDLRRSAVRNLIRSGVSKTVVKQISGHQTDAVFDRYNITSDEDIQDAQQKVERYLATLPAKSTITTIGQAL